MFTYVCHNFPNRPNEPTKRKPDVIIDYNNFMLGVDKLDQMMSYYSFLHKSIKWWRKVFFWIVEMIVVNAYIIHKKTQADTGNNMTHLAFRRELITQLVDTVQTSRPVSTASSNIDRLSGQPHFLEKQQKRRDCVVCSDRSENSERHLTLYVCSTCTDNPALCPDECFKSYHTRKRYK